MTIIQELIKIMKDSMGERDIVVEDVRIGIFYTAAKLSTGDAGVAFTPRDLEDTVCCPHSAAKMPASGKLKGKKALELMKLATSDISLKRSVGIAVLNALSALKMKEEEVKEGRIKKDADALDVVEIKEGDKVAMVGAFVPFIKKLKGRSGELYVIDKHPQALKAEERHMWRSPALVGDIMPRADIVVITGSSMVEGGLDELLSACTKAREIILAGPTASAWPEPFFKRGVTVMGGISIHDPDKLLQVVSEGGSGYFFTGPARKVAVIRGGDS
ncbi:MAG: DUF364 domain-containing protein [Syntrophales bacterium]|nr:DUF364 domain-containing protein [Syntrophales bacterium]